jgi:hypothetical protein
MPVIYRVWVDVEVYDPATEMLETVEVDFGPSATFVAADGSALARAVAECRAVDFAEQLHDGRGRAVQDGVAS